jgi:hypothetical protein
MPNWIYESPDGGRTIYRRIMGKHETREQMVLIGEEDWMTMGTVMNMAKQSVIEQNLRNQHPQLQEAWDSYHALLRLMANGEEA